MKKIQKLFAVGLLFTLIPFVASAQSLNRGLRRGLSGDDVKVLQALLAADSSIYPEANISGYYGTLTQNAVRKFQKKYNLDQVGVVGPKTLKKLNELRDDFPVEVRNIQTGNSSVVSGSSSTTASVVCAKIPPGHLIAPGWLRKNKDHEQIIPDCQILPPGIEKQLTGGTTTPPSVPDTTAPNISGLSYLVGTTSATVLWTTNEFSTTKIYIGTTSPVMVGTSTLVQVDGLYLSHYLYLNNLTASTTYYLIAVSADRFGNTATSSQVSFTTNSVISDTTAPVITWNFPYVSTSSAVVMWTTNEPATGKLYYATTSPLVLASSTVLLASSLSMSQTLTLPGLTASTTYYYLLEAKDSANNIGTSTEQSFTTRN